MTGRREEPQGSQINRRSNAVQGSMTLEESTERNDVAKSQSLGMKGPKPAAVASAIVQSTVPAWLNIVIITAFIFGGCCSNISNADLWVIICRDDPNHGTLITFAQFVIIALLTLPTILSSAAGLKSLFISKPAIPLKSWAIYTAFFMSVNLLNNAAFIFKISVPLHIIVRSGGPVASMVVGYLYNSRRYTPMQVISVTILSAGVVAAAIADASAKGKSLDLGLAASEGSSLFMTLAGFMILGLAMVLAAFQGVYADWLYQKYGRDNWREGLFYSHALSIPFLLPSYPQLYPQLKSLLASPSVSSVIKASPVTAATSESPSQHFLAPVMPLLHLLSSHPSTQPILSLVPIKISYLLLNGLTQYLCIRGVYLLSAKTSSLTVVIVLNIRKLVSLILSVYLFGNVLTFGVLAGATLVFLGGGIYAYEGARLRRQQSKDKNA
ncbi:UPD-GlcNAc transporter [Trichophyton tonsurans CBS 112818]|uniref:UPD-GlcNAc transporter n=1 Tax=Trichophyton tonsurans (strain CBS 112818) TaxID=647933 RepID=F2RXY0_TRIT1|nr:UPD-GlcNAc transporter [Trichophyton tonsurans CBS 112818]